jgi:hypothetical protein
MRRLTWLVPLFLAGLVGTAQAQVATTDFVPAAPVFVYPVLSGLNGADITPDNPAALAWGTPSRVAAGPIKGSIKNNLFAAPSIDYDGEFYGARFVGGTWGFAAEQSRVKATTPGFIPNWDQSHDAQISLNLGNRLALGVGAGKTKSDVSGQDFSRTELGASLRLGDVWYLGAGTYKDKDSAAPGSPQRNAVLAGVALRTQGSVKWYVAYDYIKQDGFTSGGVTSLGMKVTQGTVQMLAGPFLLGVSAGKIEVSNTTPSDIHRTIYDIGFAPMTGLTISARMQRTRITDNTPTDVSTDTNSVALAWQW